MAYDPTLASVEQFSDPSKWERVIPNVPIFKPHKVKDKKGKDLVVDPKRLEEICHQIKELFDRRGVAVRFQRGHTKNPTETDQADQPEIYGFGLNPHIGRFGPDKELGILVDMYVRPGCMKYVSELPYRSSEFYPDTNEITAVALLRTDPKLDMGMLLYQDDTAAIKQDRSGRVYFYMENVMDFDPTKKPGDEDMDKDLGSFGDDDTLNKPGGDDDHDGIPNDLDPDFEGKMDAYMDKKYPHFGKMYQEGCKKYMSMPSSTNTSLPGEDPMGDKPPMDKPEPDGDEQYGRDKLPEFYQREMSKMKKELETQKRHFAESERKRVFQYSKAAIERLKHEGVYIGDPKTQINKLCALPNDEARDERLNEMRQFYQRDPAAGNLVIADRDGEFYSEAEISEAESNEFVEFYQREGKSAEDLLNESEYRAMANKFRASKNKSK